MRILLIEDERLLRWSLEQSLKKMGYDVQAFDNGKAALESLEKDTYDFVITDYRLPDICGFEIINKTVAVQPQAQIVVISAYLVPSIIEGIEKFGHIHIISKPFRFEELIGAIKEASPSK